MGILVLYALSNMKRVVYITGGNSWIPCYISIYSLLKNNQNVNFKIFLISEDNLHPAFRTDDFLKQTHDNHSIHYIHEETSNYSNMPAPDDSEAQLTIGVYFRLRLRELLPVTSGNILYIDADTLVLEHIQDIFNKNMSDHVIAACPSGTDWQFNLSLSPDKKYFNAGVCLINLDNWCSNDIGDKCIQYIIENEPALNDQAALNQVCHGLSGVKMLPPQYNVHGKWMKRFQESNHEPKIVHYNGPRKPWIKNVNRRYKQTYHGYFNETDLDSSLKYTQTNPKTITNKLISRLRNLIGFISS